MGESMTRPKFGTFAEFLKELDVERSTLNSADRAESVFLEVQQICGRLLAYDEMLRGCSSLLMLAVKLNSAELLGQSVEILEKFKAEQSARDISRVFRPLELN